jgi:hypothetical protein
MYVHVQKVHCYQNKPSKKLVISLHNPFNNKNRKYNSCASNQLKYLRILKWNSPRRNLEAKSGEFNGAIIATIAWTV